MPVIYSEYPITNVGRYSDFVRESLKHRCPKMSSSGGLKPPRISKVGLELGLPLQKNSIEVQR